MNNGSLSGSADGQAEVCEWNKCLVLATLL